MNFQLRWKFQFKKRSFSANNLERTLSFPVELLARSIGRPIRSHQPDEISNFEIGFFSMFVDLLFLTFLDFEKIFLYSFPSIVNFSCKDLNFLSIQTFFCCQFFLEKVDMHFPISYQFRKIFEFQFERIHVGRIVR